MPDPTRTFRERYRQSIHPAYHAGLHALFVFGVGLFAYAYQLHQIHLASAWQWLAAPAGLLMFNAGWIFGAHATLGYLMYEFFHTCHHLPDGHWITRLPWFSQMRQLHRLHHRRTLMQTHNFNIVFPMMDWLCGTLHWEAPRPPQQ